MSLNKALRRSLVLLPMLAAMAVGGNPCILAQTADDFSGSVVRQQATAGVLPLSLSRAIEMGLKSNLGAILAGTGEESAGGQKLRALQALLPDVTGTANISVSQVNLQAEGLRIPGFPAVIGPFGYTDFRATLNQALVNVPSLENYLASKHDLAASKLSAQDAQDLIVLTVGNAYLLCLADQALIASNQAQVKTSKISLDQAVQNHRGGVSPRIDELRARVDFQTQEQALIASQNEYRKDRIALARSIGLPLNQKFKLTDTVPFQQMNAPTMAGAMATALQNRSDLKAAEERVQSAERSLSAAHAEWYPSVTAETDYGAIGVNPANSHGTLNATAQASGPIFELGKLRGDAKIAGAQLQQAQAQLNNLKGQIRAQVKDAILDIETAQKLVAVSRGNVQLANEALEQAQERFKAGVSDNLAVSQAQSTVAQANEQYVSSLYQFNVAKLSLARATGVTRTQYKNFDGGH
jgi:outer membrane protein TolC